MPAPESRLGRTGGFTLIELMIVVAIIGILAMIAMPRMVDFLNRTKVARAVKDLRTIVDGFELYAAEHYDDFPTQKGYPDDTHRVLPTGLEDYIDPDLFEGGTPFGGYYNWEGPDNYSYAGVAYEAPTSNEALITQLDEKIDDGDLNTGFFRKTPNSRYTFILWER